MQSLQLLLALSSLFASSQASYWLGNVEHQGLAPFASAGYKVFRNVQDYGAKGDGVTDDTAAINAAITEGSRCGQGCDSTTETPAIVYFPTGTYMISAPIIPYYFTQMIGDATDLPSINATAGFSGFSLLDTDPYFTANLNWMSTNVFYKQVRNLVLDSTLVPADKAINLLHWPTSQATALQNIVFNMPVGSSHVGIFMESGSGGFLSDLTFNGGNIGAQLGNQQFTMRNLFFNNCATAISQLWSWGWTYMGLSINNCGVGLDMSAAGSDGTLEVGSITVIDSTISNTPIGIKTGWATNSMPATAGSLIVENVALNNVPTAIQGPDSKTVLAGSASTMTIAGWGEGHEYSASSTAVTQFQGTITPNSRPAALTTGSANFYYTRSKPLYTDVAASSIVSARTSGAVGDGVTDDTAALQKAITNAASSGSLLFIDYGIYKVTSTIEIPAGAKIVGETFPIIMSSGAYFADYTNPQVVVRIGPTSGATGAVELSDFIVGTQGQQPGAILIEYNFDSPAGTPSGMWDVHVRVGGFAGSDLQVAQCPTLQAGVNEACKAGYMSMHITAASSGLYMENCWLWTADHDIEDPSNTQVTIYNARGLYVESTEGPFWFIGTAVEHHTLYNYQFANTKNVFASQLQTETPYYQPVPDATVPFVEVTALNDPTYSCDGGSGNCADAWGLRILDSSDMFLYGANHYSFFNNYNLTCSTFAAGQSCQTHIVRLEGTLDNVNIYNLNTVGVQSMIDNNGQLIAPYSDNENVFASNVALYRTG